MIDITRAYSLNFLIAQNDSGIGRILRDHGEFARIESEIVIEYMRLSGGGTYVDVGANIGTIALPVASSLPDVRVVAIEAQRIVAGLLAANALNNHLYNVEVLHAAAGASVGLTPFPQGRLGSGPLNFGVVGAYLGSFPTENVRVCTLDEVSPADTRFVKIDVEGAEPEVLKGAGRLLNEIRPVWLIEANVANIDTAKQAMRAMFDAGYRLFWFYAPLVSPVSQKLPQVAQNNKGDMNFIALPPGVPNIWDLQEFFNADDPSPVNLSSFRYLERLKFKLQPRTDGA